MMPKSAAYEKALLEVRMMPMQAVQQDSSLGFAAEPTVSACA